VNDGFIKFPRDEGDFFKEIEKLWKRFQQKKQDGSGFSLKWVVLIILAILVMVGVNSSYFTVDTAEKAVVLKFGKYQKTVGEGLNFKWPFGIDRVIKVPISAITMDFSEHPEENFRRSNDFRTSRIKNNELVATGDLNVVAIEWKIEYRIINARKYLFNARNPSQNIRDISMSVIRRVVGDLSVNDVIEKRAQISPEAKILTQKILDQYDLGIEVVILQLRGVNPPNKVKPAFNDVNSAKQEQRQMINDAEKEYNKVIPLARGEADKKIADAEAYAVKVINQAKGDSKRFDSILGAYRQAPKITKKRLYLETFEKILKKVDRFTLIDESLKGILPLYSAPGSAKFPSLEGLRIPQSKGGQNL